MAKVDLISMRTRLDMMEAAFSQIRLEGDANGGRLRRQDTWRQEYLHDPYLVGAPDERLASRFKDIFINQIDLTSEGKIGLMSIEETDWTVKFTHIMEEYGTRGCVPEHVIQTARTPILRYFEHGPPIAKQIFDGFAAPQGSYLVKYGRRDFLEEMLRIGRFRLSPASYYGDTGYNDAIRDDEVSRTFCIPTYLDRLKGGTHLNYQGHRIPYDDDDIVIPVTFPDYFLMSLCDAIYYRMPTDFDADAALIIRTPHMFEQKVISTFLARFPGWSPLRGPVTYYDPYLDFKKCKVPQMVKHFGYSYQREHRIAFIPPQPVAKGLAAEFFEIGSMEDYATLLSA